MPRSLSLTALQVNALTTSDNTILYNAQARDISLYGGTNIASLLTQLEIDNVSGDCLTLRCNSDVNNYANFKMNSSGTFDIKINNGDKSFNIVNHNGSTFGLKLNGTLVTSTAAELSKLSGYTGTSTNLNYLSGVTPGTASAGKALVTDASNNLSGINDLSTQNLTVAGTLVTASATELNYTDITTAGTAQAAKALVVDVNKDISGIRNLSATNLTGTIQTASQPNITSVGTLSNLTVDNQITTSILDASTILVDGVDITTAISGSDPTAGITPGTVSASKVLMVDSNKDLTGMRNLTSTGTITASTFTGTLSAGAQNNVTTLTGATSVGKDSSTTLTGTLATAAQGNITSVGTLTGLTSNGNLDVAEHNGIDKGLKLGGTLVTAAASEINKLTGVTASSTDLNKIAGVTSGTVSASKALVVDGNKDLSGIRNITTTGTISGGVAVSATTLTGTISTASQPNITSLGTLANLTVSNQITTSILDASTILVDGVDITTAISGSDPTTGITPGTVSASKVLLVDSSKNLTGMGNLTSTGTITASTLTGTLSSGAQTGVTGVGTLSSLTSNGDVNVAEHDGSTKGLKLAGTLVTSTAGDLNKLSGITSGTTSASKALVVDSNKDLTGIRNITSTGTVTASTLTGTLSSGAQTGITGVGTLSSLTSNGDVNVAEHDGSTKGLQLGGTLVTAVATDLNKLSGVTEGTVSASKAVIVNTNKDLSGIRNLTTTGTISGVTTLTATTLAGTLSTAAQGSITSVGTLTGLTSNGDVDIAEHDGSTKGLKLGGTLVNATATDLNKLSNVTASAADLNTTTGVTAGTVTASKHLVVDSSKNLTGMGDLTSTGTITASTLSGTTLTGTLSAGAQNNVTTLNGATSVGKDSSTTLTGTLATASQPNITTLAGVTSIGASSTTTLTGTLQSAAQGNITSVGTLTSLALSGAISGATDISNSGIITNTDSTASSSNSTGSVKLSGGVGISNTTDATSSTNGGTFTTAGGAAIAKKLYVGSDLTVGGNLTISGITTTINSTTTTITDNTLLLNSGPSGTGFDSGVITQRYQTDNALGTGDIVGDTAKESYAISSGTTTTITLPSGANSTNDYYNNWWLKITSGTLANQVRKITAYNGTTKVATLSATLSGSPSSNDNISLYNKSFTALLWNESNKQFVSAFTSNDTSTPGALSIIDYANFRANNITGTLATASQPNITSVGTLTGLTSSGAISITNNTASTNVSTGALTVTGGIGVAGAANIGGALAVTGNITGTLATASQPNITSVGTLTGLTSSGAISITDSTASSSTTTGALKVTGGVGVTGAVNIGGALAVTGNITGTLATASQPNITTLGGVTSIGASSATTLTGTLQIAAQANITSVGTLTGLTSSGAISITDTTTSSSTTTGALIVTGGVGVAGAANIGGALTVTGNITGTLATASQPNITTLGGVTSIGASSATILTGTLATAAQANITSVGTLTGLTSSGNVTLSGTSSTLSLSGASSVITLSNTTASTNSSTGALQVAGGAYFGANSLFNSNLTLNGTLIAGNAAISASSWTTSGIQLRSVATTYTNSSTASSGTAASAVFNSFARPTLAATNTTVTTTNAATLYIANSPAAGTNMTITNAYALWVATGTSLFGGNINTNGINSNSLNTGNVITTTPTSYISLNDSPIYFRGTSGADRNHFLSYAGNTAQTNWNAGKGFGNPGTANDGPVLCGNTNVIIGTLAGTGTETIVGNFTSSSITFSPPLIISSTTASTSTSTGALRVSGGVGIGGAVNTGGNIKTAGQLITNMIGQGFIHNDGTINLISYVNNSFAGTAYFGTDTNHNLALQTNGSSKLMIAAAGNITMLSSLGLNNTSPSYVLDLGSTASNMQISLFGGLYGIGACNSNLQSFSNGGFSWSKVTTAVTGNGAAPGTNLAKLYGTGHFEATGGLRATEFAANNYTGQGIEIHYSSSISTGDVFCYDRTNNAYKTLKLNNIITILPTGYVGIGTTSPSKGSLHVATTLGSSTESFIFYAKQGSTSYIGAEGSPTNISIYAADRVVGSQFNAFSDIRIKNNIIDIDDLSALNTLRLIEPKRYNYVDTYKKTNKPVWGFIAQQISDVLEYSVNLITDWIPNIYQLGNKSSLDNGDNILSFANAINYDSNGTGKIQIIDINNKYISVTIKNKIDNNSFSINEILEEEEYFIYGEEVNNFHSLNKDAIFTITTAAVQEIDRYVIENKNKITTLENTNILLNQKITSLEQKNNDLETRLARLEAFISTLEITE